MIPVFALYNAKGGSAKTTTAVHLASMLAKGGRRVLLVDLDTSGAATGYFQQSLASSLSCTDFVLRKKPISKVAYEVEPGLFLVSYDDEMEDSNPLWDKLPCYKQEGLWNAFEEARQSGDLNFDVVVLDVPGRMGLVPENAVLAATHHLVLIQPDRHSFEEAMRTEEHAQVLFRRAKRPDACRGFLLTRVPPTTRKAVQLVMAMVQAQWPTQTLNHYIKESALYANMGLSRTTAANAPGTVVEADLLQLIQELTQKGWLK